MKKESIGDRVVLPYPVTDRSRLTARSRVNAVLQLDESPLRKFPRSWSLPHEQWHAIGHARAGSLLNRRDSCTHNSVLESSPAGM